MFELVLLSICLTTALFWYFLVRPMCYWKNQGVPQSKHPWIVLGDCWGMLHSFNGKNAFLDFIAWIHRKSKANRYFGFYIFNIPVLCVTDPELIKTITIKDFDHFTDHHSLDVDHKVDPFWGGNILTLKGQRWRHMRSIITPSYTSGKLRGMFDRIMDTTDQFVKSFSHVTDAVTEVEIKDVFTRFTNDVAATTLMGIKVDSLNEKDNLFYKFGQSMTNTRGLFMAIKLLCFQFSPFATNLFRLNFIKRGPGQYFTNVLRNTISDRALTEIKRPDILNVLLEARNKMSADSKNADLLSSRSIYVNTIILFFASVDTVSSSLSWGAYELALNKDVQDRLREEVRKEKANNDKITYDVIIKMTYMDMVVSEIVRKWPSFASTDRKVSKPYTIQPVRENETPVYLEKGRVIWFPIFSLLRDPEYFPDPDKFDPERFSPENKHNINPYVYIPFGAGPRMCVASRLALFEIKALLFNLLLNFEIVPTSKTQDPVQLESYHLQYQPEGGFHVGLKRIMA